MLCNDSCRPDWSPDGRRFFMWYGFFAGRRPLVIAPVPAGRTFPEFPANDSPTFEQWAALPGAEAVQQDHFIPSNDPVDVPLHQVGRTAQPVQDPAHRAIVALIAQHRAKGRHL